MSKLPIPTSDGKHQFTIKALIILCGAMLILDGCAGNSGRLQRSREVDEIFKAYQIVPDHRYYYAGPEGRPDAIIGIQRGYSLETSQWTPFDPHDDTLKKGVDSINFHYNTTVRRYPYGFIILDPGDNRLGIWYSIWDWTTIIREEDNRIKVFPPAMEEPFENGDDLENKKFD